MDRVFASGFSFMIMQVKYMDQKLIKYLAALMLAVGLAASVVLVALNWVHDGRFHDECYLAVGDWMSHKVAPPKTSSAPKYLAADELLIAVDKAGRPINRPIAVFTEIRLPDEAASFVLSRRIEANLAALDLKGYATVFVVAIACSLSVAFFGLALIIQSNQSQPKAAPFLFGAVPLAGFSMANANFYLLYVRPWDEFTKAYYIDAAGPKLSFPVLWVGVILAFIAAGCAWLLRSTRVDKSIRESA